MHGGAGGFPALFPIGAETGTCPQALPPLPFPCRLRVLAMRDTTRKPDPNQKREVERFEAWAKVGRTWLDRRRSDPRGECCASTRAQAGSADCLSG